MNSLLLLVLLLLRIEPSRSFTAPTFGLTSLFFPIRNKQFTTADKTSLRQASDFFVDAFWTAKVGGGAKELSKFQRQELQSSQFAEFNRRYGGRRRQAELVLCLDDNDNLMAVAGVEVDRIPDQSSSSSDTATATLAPLMSNLAVGRDYRRRGLAKAIVLQVEELVQKEWGYDECFLYVEQRNRAAVRLYESLGYRYVWKDSSATTLLPSPSGELRTTPTVMVCMRKQLKKKSFLNLF